MRHVASGNELRPPRGGVSANLARQFSPSRTVVGIAIAVAAACSTIVVWSSLHFGAIPIPEAANRLLLGPLARAWARWDSGWYVSIARNGYTYGAGNQSPVAFFPGYPLTIRALANLGLDLFTSGFLVTLGCGILACWLFVRWAATKPESK